MRRRPRRRCAWAGQRAASWWSAVRATTVATAMSPRAALHAAGRRVDAWQVGRQGQARGDARAQPAGAGAHRGPHPRLRRGPPAALRATSWSTRSSAPALPRSGGRWRRRHPQRPRLARRRACGCSRSTSPRGLQRHRSRLRRPAWSPTAPCLFGAMKLGLALEPGASLAGRGGGGRHRPGGGPGSQTWLLGEADGPRWLPVRRADSNKGSYGHLLVVAGSPGRPGRGRWPGWPRSGPEWGCARWPLRRTCSRRSRPMHRS